jgi:hypothetical protein
VAEQTGVTSEFVGETSVGCGFVAVAPYMAPFFAVETLTLC